jgi:hypothetical protein
MNAIMQILFIVAWFYSKPTQKQQPAQMAYCKPATG